MLPYAPQTVAEAVLALLDQAAAARGRAVLAIPGGRSPGPVLTALARICDRFVRDRLDLFWLDERCVPLGHPERNDAPTLAAWLAGGPLPARVHAMPAESPDLAAACAAYTQEFVAAGGVLDVCLIGIGEDGHLASLFPHHAGLKELDPVFSLDDSPKPPAQRMTFGLGPICSARARLILALGAAKGAVVAGARRGPDPGLPVSLLPAEGTFWYCDDAAVEAVR